MLWYDRNMMLCCCNVVMLLLCDENVLFGSLWFCVFFVCVGLVLSSVLVGNVVLVNFVRLYLFYVI